ncbi:MAG: CoA ester lyase [Anaerolineales bacterium]|nr:CoA ester lyase [Anaerolineales bacterium]
MNLRRSLLYMPGTDWRKIEKAATELNADSVCLDLEDGVALNAKAEARETIVRALQTLDFRQTEKLVRINSLDSGLASDDLDAVLVAHPEGIVVPKVRGANQIQWLHDQLSSAEDRYGWKRGSTILILIIESARGIVNLDEIVKASPRIAAIVFGAEDFASDIGAVRTREAFEVLYARSKVVTYAKARGLQAIDIVYADFRDPEGFTAEAQQGMMMGFTGKQLIHPNQIPLVHAVYMPTEAEIAHARRVVEAHAAYQASGTGAFALDGKMVDMPVVKQAELVLERAGGKVNT